MNDNYYSEHTSCTFSSIAIVGLIVTQLLLNPNLSVPRKDLNIPLGKSNVYQSTAITSTFDQFRSLVTGEYYQGINQFEAAISDFYSALITGQELLGIEFEKVLYENLWNLYES
jgi:hypothetical protein